MKKPAIVIPGLHWYARDWMPDDANHRRPRRNRTYEFDAYAESFHSLLSGPQMDFIRAAVKAGGALCPTDLDHFSDAAPHLQLLSDLLDVEGLACHDDEGFRSVAQKSALHVCFRPNPRLAHLLYAWLRSLGYRASQILEATHMAVQDAQLAPVFERFETRLPDMRQEMPLPACLRKNLLATT
jgi:hypothetical protein